MARKYTAFICDRHLYRITSEQFGDEIRCAYGTIEERMYRV